MSKIPFQNFPPAWFWKINSENNLRYWPAGDDFKSHQSALPPPYKYINTIFMSKHIFLVKKDLTSNKTL